MTTYEHRLRQIAEEFAKKDLEGVDNRAMCEEVIQWWMPFAEIAIRREGEAFDEGAESGEGNTYISGGELYTDDVKIQKRKHYLGLIKPTTDGE